MKIIKITTNIAVLAVLYLISMTYVNSIAINNAIKVQSLNRLTVSDIIYSLGLYIMAFIL
jgi:hypothetical protein